MEITPDHALRLQGESSRPIAFIVFLLLKVAISHFLISQLLYYLKHWSMILQSKSLFKLYAFGKYLALTLSICCYESVEQVISRMCNESVVAVNVFSLL